MCDNCDKEWQEMDDDRKRLAQWMIDHPKPCIICDDINVVGAGTWIAGDKQYLAIGSQNFNRIFAFSLCETHVESTEENEKLIMQAIVRLVRNGGTGKEV